ncbi:MAG: hypothetical protein IIZ78_03450 [Clostridiales bacterium]|nr:hypothetical protein [Clostridiales bacterium]
MCSKNTYIVDEKIIKRILDGDMVKSYDKHKDELFEYGLQDPDTIRKIEEDINHPEDTDIISDVTSEDKPMDGDIRKLEYDILSTYMDSVNMSYTDIVCAIFTNYKDKEDNVYYNVIIGYGDEKIYDIFKKIKLS